MKKAIKLVWMVLFALPLISLTSCGDDDDPVNVGGIEVSFKDYSYLIGKSRVEVQSDMNLTISNQDQFGIYYDAETVNEPHIGDVDVFFTVFQKDDNGNYILTEKASEIEVEVTGYTQAQIFDYLGEKYGKPSMNEYGRYTFEKGNLIVWFEWDEDDSIAEITYIDKKEWDKAYGTKGATVDVKALMKAHKAELAK